MYRFQYPLRVKWILQRAGRALRFCRLVEFQYPLRVKWILQPCCLQSPAYATRSVSVPSTGQVDSSTEKGEVNQGVEHIVSVPSTGQVDSSTRSSRASARHRPTFQYPLRVKWILQPQVAQPIGIRPVVSVPSTGQVDSSTPLAARIVTALAMFQYPLRVKWILQQEHARV